MIKSLNHSLVSPRLCVNFSYSQSYYASSYKWFLCLCSSLVPRTHLALQPGFSPPSSGSTQSRPFLWSGLSHSHLHFVTFFLFFRDWLKSQLSEDNFTESDIKLYFYILFFYLDLIINFLKTEPSFILEKCLSVCCSWVSVNVFK